MKFGIMQLVSGGFGRTEREVYANTLELTELADRLGFTGAWFAEHHGSTYGLLPNVLQFCAVAATRTTSIRLGPAVVVTPLHHPVRIAEEAAFVDVLSGGRLDLGVGRGYQPREFRSFNIDMESTRDRFEESIRFLEETWAGDEPFDFDGTYFAGEGVYTLPRPVQQPGPPLWYAAVSSSTFEAAGRGGRQILTSPNFTPLDMVRDNFEVYRKHLADAGHDPGAFEYPMMQQVYVGADDDRAYEEPRDACLAFFRELSSMLPSKLTTPSADDSYSEYRRSGRMMADLKYDYLWENGVTYGSSQRVVDRIGLLKEKLGLTYFIGWFNFASLDHGLAKESLHRFAEEVMPAFAD